MLASFSTHFDQHFICVLVLCLITKKVGSIVYTKKHVGNDEFSIGLGKP